MTSAERLRAAAIAAGDAVTCSVCGQQYRPWQHGHVPAHGPYRNRCPGGGRPPATPRWTHRTLT
jgi:hypothetical protein